MSSTNEKIMKIMSLALEISPADAEENSGKPHVFVEYSPHCGLLEVRVYLKGWNSEIDADYEKRFYGSEKYASKKADRIIDYLENLRKEVCENGK